MVDLIHAYDGTVEAKLGRLTGTEDGLTVPPYESRLTDPERAAGFVQQTGSDALAVCTGNMHGRYRTEPQFDWDQLYRQQADVPLSEAKAAVEHLVKRMFREDADKL